MDFGLAEDHASVRDSVRNFARAELAPGYLARSKRSDFPWAVHKQVAELGVLGLLAGADHNPLDAEDFVAAGLAVEELAYADVNVANAVIPVMLVASLLSRHGSEHVRGEWLGPLVGGRTYVSFCLTEADSGSDAAALRTKAVAVDGGYVISGEKASVTMAAHASALIVTAQTYREGVHLGVSAFLVEMDDPGITTSGIADTGWKPMGRSMVHLDEVRVDEGALLGAEGAAFRSVLNGFDFTRPLLALTGVGCAQASLDETAAYVRERSAFGSPLARFEGVSFPLAEHSTTLEAARLLCYSALWKRGSGVRHTADAAMTKWYGPKMAGNAIKECLLLHGNYGYSAEFPFEQRLRDVLALEIADGTAQIQKIIISRELFGAEFTPYRG
ncbi:acyl-CoA dehydrogenase family protein [Saccharopolyspora sp. HNM0986]|uniref:acyl-CoA dehydrogenase family protein n=1 Tax=Saccharopolyspora galaxeae TaxID=2781241 RepID=UPI00190D747E|nr:acyl-CoA dehydrogenase family protein [Saccharopolyspora sp. HNM0986]MBK0870412.1 acyl-CoA dehydrogenase family protein [Saccharopolyspora sp. HNM0986]